MPNADHRINVLWVIDHVCYDGSLHGGGRLYWNLLPHFDAARFRVIPCLLRADEEVRGLFSDVPVPVRILDKAKFDPTTLGTFLGLIRSEQIDVMHLHCYAASSFGRLAGVLTGVPAIIHDYDTEVYFPYPSYLGLADRLLAGRTHAAMAASPMCRRFLEDRRKMDPERVHTMFHAIPEERFAPIAPERIAALRNRIGIDPGTRVVGTVTKLGPQRGNEQLIRAAAEVLKHHADVVFLIAYKPTLFHRLPSKEYVAITQEERKQKATELEELARELGIADRVRLVEWTDDADDLNASLDVFVAPFLSERFSSVALLEAMAMGKPVVATRLGEQCEIVIDGVNGFLVPPENHQELADRIRLLLQDPPALERIGAEARNSARSHSVKGCVSRLQALYVEAVEQRRGRQ